GVARPADGRRRGRLGRRHHATVRGPGIPDPGRRGPPRLARRPGKIGALMTPSVENLSVCVTPADLFTPRGRLSVVRVWADRGADRGGGGATVLTTGGTGSGPGTGPPGDGCRDEPARRERAGRNHRRGRGHTT